ncbi:UNVERIFIED_CONTAM: hypothetical protein NCL1_29583 [Trichonephila clavipes]
MAASSASFIPTPLAHADHQGEGSIVIIFREKIFVLLVIKKLNTLAHTLVIPICLCKSDSSLYITS